MWVSDRQSRVDIKPGATFELGVTTAAAATTVDQSLDRPGLIRRMLDVVPNPWQGARILDEALGSVAQSWREGA